MAIIGLGNFGKKIIVPIQHFYQNEEIVITAVCDSNEEEVRGLVKELGVKGYSNYKECIDDPTVDLVYVATPPATHKEIASYALKAKKHVLCEKPLAHNLEDALELVETANQVTVVNAMHFGQDYSPVFSKFRELVNEGYLGEIQQIELKMLYPSWPPTWQQTDWIMTKEQGGFLLEQGIHLVHFIRKVFGQVELISSEITFGQEGIGCETEVNAQLIVDGKVPFSLIGKWPNPDEEQVVLTVKGTSGTLCIDNWRTLKGSKDGQELSEIDAGIPHTWILDEVLKAINGEEAFLTNFSEGLEALKTIHQIRKV